MLTISIHRKPNDNDIDKGEVAVDNNADNDAEGLTMTIMRMMLAAVMINEVTESVGRENTDETTSSIRVTFLLTSGELITHFALYFLQIVSYTLPQRFNSFFPLLFLLYLSDNKKRREICIEMK